MTNEELLARIEELESENKTLKNMLNRGSSGNSSAYTEIRMAIDKKVDEEYDISIFEDWQRKHKASVMRRKIMDDLKWDLRIRNVSDFRMEHVEPAKEYIKNYVIPNKARGDKNV